MGDAIKHWLDARLSLAILGVIHLWYPQKRIRFSLPAHKRPHEPDPLPLWTSTCGRHEIHIALLKWLVQWPSRPKAEIRLYDCNLFKTVLLVIYSTNLYRRKIYTFSSIQRRNFGRKPPASLHERKTGWRQWALIFCVDVHLELTPSPPSACVHLSLTPLCVVVINGWPFMCQYVDLGAFNSVCLGCVKWHIVALLWEWCFLCFDIYLLWPCITCEISHVNFNFTDLELSMWHSYIEKPFEAYM